MAKAKNLKNLKSVRIFKENVKKTHDFFRGLDLNIYATKIFLEKLGAKKKPDYKKFKYLLEFNKKRLSYLYELGFIALFSNFEFFMFDFLKDLFKKYPSSFKSEKLVCFEDISDFENVKEIKEYFIDSLAIKNSYSMEQWGECLKQKFGITIFKTKKQYEHFLMLNELRNIFLHSAGKTTSKFRDKMKTFMKSKVPLGKKAPFDRKKYFEVLYGLFNALIKNIEKL